MVLEEAKDSVSSLDAVGHEIFTGSVDGRLRKYDLRMGMLSVDVVGGKSIALMIKSLRCIRSTILIFAAPLTSLTPTLSADSILVSTLDSTVRLMDKADGKLLRKFQDPAFQVSTYRVRSALAAKDAIAVSGSEDGFIYAWDLLSGERVLGVQHNDQDQTFARPGSRVVSTIACKRRGGEWASAGGDGKFSRVQNPRLLQRFRVWRILTAVRHDHCVGLI